jgi:hypothetical protein
MMDDDEDAIIVSSDDDVASTAETTIFVGMDVTRSSLGSQNGVPSIAAVFITEEPTYFVHWLVNLQPQPPEEDTKSRELIDDLQATLKERLDRYTVGSKSVAFSWR